MGPQNKASYAQDAPKGVSLGRPRGVSLLIIIGDGGLGGIATGLIPPIPPDQNALMIRVSGVI